MSVFAQISPHVFASLLVFVFIFTAHLSAKLPAHLLTAALEPDTALVSDMMVPDTSIAAVLSSLNNWLESLDT